MTDKSTQQCSPLIKSIENKLGIAGRLTQGGYSSVFDILKVSRGAFVRDNTSALGAKSEKVYDIATGLANQVRRGFRKTKLTTNIQSSLQSTSPGQASLSAGYGVQAFIKTGPTWQNQFDDDWGRYCKNGAPEAYDSPVSYLSWLYNQARTFEKDMEGAGSRVITLAQRRPDLPQLLIDDEAINKTVPSLTLVNDILTSAVAPYVAKLTPTTSVDQTLSTTRYPNILPYHYPHDQAVLSLSNTGQSLSDIISQTDKSWPYFIASDLKGDNSEAAWETGSELAPEQINILTEATNAASSAFYLKNFGYNTSGYPPFTASLQLCQSAGISSSQLQQLLACSEEATKVVTSLNVSDISPMSSQYGASFINANVEPSLAFMSETHDSISKNGLNALQLSYGESGSSYSNGRFGEGLPTYSENGSYAYFMEESEVAATLKGDKSFTLGFWIYIPEHTTDRTPIVSNGGDATDTDYAPGFSFTTYDGLMVYAVGVCDSTGKNVNNSWNYYYPSKTWTYIAFIWNASTKQLTFKAGDTTIYLDASTLGDITTRKGFTWAFNVRGDLTLRTPHTVSGNNFIYDEIAVFDKCLSESDIDTIRNANVPLADIISTTINPKFYYQMTGKDAAIANLSDSRMDRINRMVRLQRWLDLPYDQVDLLISSCIRAQRDQNKDFSANNQLLRMLGVFRRYHTKFSVTAQQFAAVIDQISPYALTPETPFFDQLFNSPSLFEEPLRVTGASFTYTALTGDSSRIVKQICAGLNISEAQFLFLANKVAHQQGDSVKKTLPCSLSVISAFYRLVMIPRWLGLSFADGVTLFGLLETGDIWSTLAGVPVLSPLNSSTGEPVSSDILDTLMALESAAEWVQQHDISLLSSKLACTPGELETCNGAWLSPLSMGITDYTYNSTSGAVTLTQQVTAIARVDIARITLQYPLPAGLVRNGEMGWDPTSDIQGGYDGAYWPAESDELLNPPSIISLKAGQKLILNVHVKGTFANPLELYAMQATLTGTIYKVGSDGKTYTQIATQQVGIPFASPSLMAGNEELNFLTQINQQIPSTLITDASFAGISEPCTSNLLSIYAYAPFKGRVYQGLDFESLKRQYATFNAQANTLAAGNSAYTLGGWYYIGYASVSNGIMITNTDIDTNSYAGIKILTGNSHKLSISIGDGSKTVTNTGTMNWENNSQWFYLALTLDPLAKILTVYLYNPDSTIPTVVALDYSSLAGTIVPPSNYIWSVNEDGTQSYYLTHTTTKEIVVTDDLTLWTDVLSRAQLDAIVASNRPANETVPSASAETHSWLSVLSTLVDSNGLVLPVVPAENTSVYDTLRTQVSNIVDDYYYSSPVTLDQVTDAVTAVIYQAKLTQDGVADSAVAQLMQAEQALSPFLLRWAASSEYDLLSQSLTLKDVSQPQDVTESYLQLLYQLLRRAAVCKQFSLTPAMVSTFLYHPERFGLSDTTLSLKLLYGFSRYGDWLKLAEKEDAVLAYLNWVNQSRKPTVAQAATALAALTGWDSSEVQDAADTFGTNGIAMNVTDVDGVMRLQSLSEQTGLSVTPLLSIGALTRNSTYQDWQTVGESLVATQTAE